MLINIFPEHIRRILGLIAVGCCIVFSFLLLKGAWDYWSIFANLPPTEGVGSPRASLKSTAAKAGTRPTTSRCPPWAGFMETLFNDGDKYEKIPRLVPYVVLPISMALLLYRYIQAAIAIWTGQADRLIVSHEAEEDVEHARLEGEA